jgi:hypothetical protein
MRLTSIVTIVLRIYALLWLTEAVVHCVAQIAESHQTSSITRTPFTFYGIWFVWILVAIIVFVLSQPIARIAVPPPNERVNVGTLSRDDLYCFAFTFLGLYFFLSSIGSAINAIHYNVIISQAKHQDAVQQSEALYRLTRPLLTLLAGLASLLLAPKLAHKLTTIHRPTFSPESGHPAEPS